MPTGFHILDDSEAISEADVLHILGCWDAKAAKLAKKAKKMGIPYVVSPLGGLSKWNMSKPRTKRALQRMRYQKGMIKNAEAILTTTPMEMEYLINLKWNHHIFRIPNAMFISQETLQHMATLMAQVYEKIYNSHEDKRIQSINEKINGDDPEHKVVAQIMLIHSRMPHKNIPGTYLTEMHHLLNDTDYSDDIVEQLLRKNKLHKFSCRLFAAMNRKTHLTEGFMPMPPKDDKESKIIEKYIK